MRNPTVRRRYEASRDLLAEHDALDLHETLLDLLGSANLTRAAVETHLAALAEAFDAAAAALVTPISFASDLTPIARPLAIEGSRKSIERGLHREAAFWIAVTYTRCMAVLSADAPPAVRDRLAGPYEALLAGLGIVCSADLTRRSDRIRAALPRIWATAEAIMRATACE